MIAAPTYTQAQVDFARETDNALRQSGYRADLFGTGGTCTALAIQCSYAPGFGHVLVTADHSAPAAGDDLTLVLAITPEQDDDVHLSLLHALDPHEVAALAHGAINRRIDGLDPRR